MHESPFLNSNLRNIKIMNRSMQCLSHTSSDSWLVGMKTELEQSVKDKSLHYNFDFESGVADQGNSSRYFWVVSDKKSLSANPSFSDLEDSCDKRKIRIKFSSVWLKTHNTE